MMVWTIATREILESLKSAKFLVGVMITIALVAVSTVINGRDYVRRQQDYGAAQQEMKGDEFNVHVYRPPELLSALVQGNDRRLGNFLEMNYLRLPPRTSGYMGEGASLQQTFIAGFASIDYAFIVRIVLSLLTIFLAFDAVAGEKSRGTLRLVHSNPVPRHVMLLGKSVGGLMVILLALLITTLVALVLLLLNPAIALRGGDWLRVLGMFCGSGLYLACIFLLALLVSVVVNRPSMSLAVLLQIWICANIIYPNVAIIAAEHWYRLPTSEELEERKQAAFQPYEEELKNINEEFNRQVMSGKGVSDELWLKNIELTARKAESDYLVDAEYSNALTHQAELAGSLSSLSPAALYDQLMERLARTGREEYSQFMDAVYRHWKLYVELKKRYVAHPDERKRAQPATFSFSPESVPQSFTAAGSQYAILASFCVLLFAAATTSFLRKDLR